MPTWSAVVISYNSGDHLLACVESLRADVSDGPGEIVVVDNGSTDGSPEAVEIAVSGAVPGSGVMPESSVVVLRPGSNLGYARAANLGIAATRAPIVVVCNPDLVVEGAMAAHVLGRFATEPTLGAIGPRIHNPDGSIYPSARQNPTTADAVGHGIFGRIWRSNPWTRRYRQLDVDWDSPRSVDWVSGAAMWLRRSALDAVGGWDEGYFMYVEDVDLCRRLRAAGWLVAYEPAVSVMHVQGVCTDHRPYRMIVEHHRSLFRFATKRWHGFGRILLVPAAGFLAARAAAAVGSRMIRGFFTGRHERGTATG